MNASDDTRTDARPAGRRIQRLAVAALALCMAAGGAMAQGRPAATTGVVRPTTTNASTTATTTGAPIAATIAMTTGTTATSARTSATAATSTAVAQPVRPNGGVAAACRPNTRPQLRRERLPRLPAADAAAWLPVDRRRRRVRAGRHRDRRHRADRPVAMNGTDIDDQGRQHGPMKKAPTCRRFLLGGQ